MISPTEILSAVRRPQYLKRGINLAGVELNKRFHHQPDSGVDIPAADWDTLILLDALRYDHFAEENWLKGRLKRQKSQGTTSLEFLRENFADRRLHDTVYVTGNPYTTRLSDDVFHDVRPLFQTDWDDEIGTVPPERVTNIAKSVHDKYPKKRIIVHYMQPHMPFLDGPEFGDVLTWGGSYYPQENFNHEAYREAYRRNVRISIEQAEDLINSIEGKIVISSDHGELLGERLWPIPVRGYDHTGGLYVPQLTDVPWFVKEKGSRRRIVSESPQSPSLFGEDVDSQLEALGYK